MEIYGDIQTIKVGTLSTIRDISIQCSSEEQLMRVVEAVNQIGEGISVHAITDDVLQAHEGGKIHMKGRMEIRSFRRFRDVSIHQVLRTFVNLSRMIQNRQNISQESQTPLQS